MAVLDSLNAAQASAAAELDSIAATMASLAAGGATEPNYSIDGKSVSLADYRRYLSDRQTALTTQIADLNSLIQSQQPFSFKSVVL